MFEMKYDDFLRATEGVEVSFNPHQNKTANNRVITVGMRVRTNEWEELVVLGDSTGVCCSMVTHPHASAQTMVDGFVYSDHATTPASAACSLFYACRHDHWFTVGEPGQPSSKTMNGERLYAL